MTESDVIPMHVAVLMGGPSWEHDISLKSAAMVINHCNPRNYKVTPVMVNRDGLWSVYPIDSKISMTDYNAWVKQTKPLSMPEALAELQARKVDICFIAMHGAFGEDGTLQGALDAVDMAYTGSPVIASSIAMDKMVYKHVLMGANITVPKSVFMHRQVDPSDLAAYCDYIEDTLGIPCVVKTPASGSSIGVNVCHNKDELATAIEKMFSLEGRLLIEQFIKGREFTCAVLGNAHRNIEALPVTEIISSNHFFDFEAKYTPGGAREITPAEIDDELRDDIQQISQTVHTIINCQGMSRTDVLVDGRTVYVLETNTIPGMTAQSLLPQAAQVAGYTLDELIDMIISYGYEYCTLKRQRLSAVLKHTAPGNQ